MSRLLLAITVALAVCGVSAPSGHSRSLPLDAYRVSIHSGADLRILAQQGFDTTERAEGAAVEITATPRQVARLRAYSLQPTLIVDGKSRSDRMIAADQVSHGGYRVWRPFARTALNHRGDQVPNISQELTRLAEARPDIVKLKTIGVSVRGLPILAVKVTKDASTEPDGSKPAVLFTSLQHAREWISGEMNRRLLHLFVDNYNGTGPAISASAGAAGSPTREELTTLVDTRELWFVLVCNPDGYDLTFTSPAFRLWRKNLRDNPSSNELSSTAGVDLNRNWPDHFGYDNQGSSSDPQSETYRGANALSEPENVALASLINEVPFTYFNNYHSAGMGVQYPFGWQSDTHSSDESILHELPERTHSLDSNPPSPTARLGLANGETTAYAYGRGTLAWTTLLSSGHGLTGSTQRQLGAVFPDDEELVQAEFRRNHPFALSLAKAATGKGQSPEGFELTAFEPRAFGQSFSSTQQVETVALRSVGSVTAYWRINGGEQHSAPASEWPGGKRYGGEKGTLYHRLRATVSGTQTNDLVEVWFESSSGARSTAFTYRVASTSQAPVLIIAGESGYVGESGRSDPKHLSYYANALNANGVPFEVWDVGKEGSTTPDPLGVLSHFKAVIWYTGDSALAYTPNQPPNTGVPATAHELPVVLREYLNEGGKLLVTGRAVGEQYFDGLRYNSTDSRSRCGSEGRPNRSCSFLSADFFQYYLGGYEYNPGRGGTPTGQVFPVRFGGGPFSPIQVSLGDGDGASTQFSEMHGGGPATMVPTSDFLNLSAFPHFQSNTAAAFSGAPGSRAVIDGNHYLHSGRGSSGYKRITRTIDLSGHTNAALTLKTSYDVEADYDYLFVEAHTVGRDDWTTLPDINGHTRRATGAACERGTNEGADWQTTFPHLAHYQTVQANGRCVPRGSTGAWNATTARSGGWEAWNIDLTAYAGKQVEIAVVFATDSGRHGTGVFVDDIRVFGNGALLSAESFEETQSPWNYSGWSRTKEILPESAAVSTPDTVWFGFGFEGIAGGAARAQVMEQVMRYFNIPINHPQPAEDQFVSLPQLPTPSPPLAITPPRPHGTSKPHPSPQKPNPVARLVIRTPSVVRVSSRGFLRVKVSCPEQSGLCNGRLVLRRGKVAIARASFRIKGGQTQTKVLRLHSGARRALAAQGKLVTRLFTTGPGAHKTQATGAEPIRLTLKRAV